MKTIYCSTCRKNVNVKDDYELKTCENCITKKKARQIEKFALNKESRKQIKELRLNNEKLSPIYKNYSTYKANYYRLFKIKPTFEEYLEALRAEKIKQAYEKQDEKKAQKFKEMPDEFLGREPQIKLEPQYEKDVESDFLGANAFHDITNETNPISKIRLQNRLKADFFDHAE